MSSAESELVALSSGALELLFHQQLHGELLFNTDMAETCTDNSAAHRLCFRRTAGQYSKHIERRCFKMRELVSLKKVRLLLVGTDHNPADLFTKVLGKDKFHRFSVHVTNPYQHKASAAVLAKRRRAISAYACAHVHRPDRGHRRRRF